MYKPYISVTIPNGVTLIGTGAFHGCSSLETVKIPDSVTAAGNSVFYDCSSLKSVTISNGLKIINSYFFYGCSKLKTVFYPDTCTVGSNAFDGSTNATLIKYNVNGGKLTITDIIPSGDETSVTIGKMDGDYSNMTADTIIYKSGLTVSGDIVSSTTTKIEYTEEGDKITISKIEVPNGVKAEIPDTIGGKPVVAVAESYQRNVGNHTHTGGTATCTKKAECTLCGNEYGELAAHAETEIPEVPATCTTAGTTAGVRCSKCNTVITTPQTIPKKEHSFTNYISNNNATCTADGTKTATCDNCTETKTVTDVGTKKEHSFTNYVSNNDATCTVDGTKTATCDNCTETKTVTDVGSKGHSYTNGVCGACGAVDPDHAHTGGTATCTQKAVCTICGAEYGELDPDNHNYAGGACTNCGKADPNAISLTVKDGTLTIRGTGTIGDISDMVDNKDSIKDVVIEDGITSIGDNAFDGFTNLETVTIPDSVQNIGDNAFPNTVKTVYYESGAGVEDDDFPDGVTKVEYSVNEDGDIIIENISGVTDVENVEIPNNIGGKPVVGVDEKIQDKVTVEGHTTHTGGTATCIALKKCAICGDEYGELGDHALNKTEEKAPTCTEDGNDAYWTCSVCAKMFSDANGTAEITEVTTIPATGHTYSEAWDSDETYHWHSATCGHDNVSEKEVHTWNDGVVETEPTIEAEGVKIYTCTICSKTKTESIPKLAHTHTYSDQWTSDKTNHWHEATCGHDNISEVAAHTEDSGTVTTPPTTEADGVRTFACSVCGRVMRTAPIPQLDENHEHNYSDWIHDEMSHWRECDCGEKTDFSEHISNGGVVTAPPTETSIGTMKYSCTVCGYVIRTEEIPALDPVIPDHSHSFGDKWEYDPTHHWHKCECGEKSDLAEHIPSGWIVETPATTDREGVQIKVCTVCGIELDRKPIANKVQDTAGTKTEFVPDNNLLDKVLTDEDKADINDNGSSYEVILEVTAKPTDVGQELISEALKPNGKLGMCVDLSLFKVKDGNIAGKEPVYKTSEPIGITLTIPDSIYAPDRNYFVVRVHGRTAENIGGTYDRTNRTLTFYTDKFSIYAIAYTASNVTPTRPSTPSIPSTPSGGGTASVSPSVSVVTPTVTETTEKTEDDVISDTPYVDDVSSAAGINETDDNSQSPLYMIVIIIAIAAVGFSSIIIAKRFAKKKRC